MALGAAQVLAERKLPGVATVGMDGASEGCKGVAEGKLTGTVYYPTMFPEALDLAMKVLDKQAVAKSTFVATPMITSANLSSYCK
jgi:ribose transport system substrate-binding protein